MEICQSLLNCSWAILGVLAIGVGMALGLLWARRRRLPLPPSGSAEEGETYLEDIEGFRIYYQIRGQGPAVVFLHGIGASSYIWRDLVPLLETDFTLVFLDLPGFGRSSKYANVAYGLAEQTRRLLMVLDQLHIEKAAVVGSSMGGALALWLGLQHPERFPNVIGLAPAWHPKITQGLRLRMAWLLPYMRPTLNPLLMRVLLLRVVTHQKRVHADMVANYLRPFRDPFALHAFRGALQLLVDAQLKDSVNRMQTRVLLLHGRRDQIVSYKYSQELHNQIPDSQLALHPLAGHHIMEDEPDFVAHSIRTFLRKTPSSS